MDETAVEIKHAKNPLKKLSAYGLCPCGDGLKFKFCCKALVPAWVPETELPAWLELYAESERGEGSW